jgi:hypothetical protein
MDEAEKKNTNFEDENTYGGVSWAEVRSWEAARAAVTISPHGRCGEMHHSWDPYVECDDPITHALLDLLMLARFSGRDVDALLSGALKEHNETLSLRGLESNVRYGLDADRTRWSMEVLSKWNSMHGGDDPLKMLSGMWRLGQE